MNAGSSIHADEREDNRQGAGKLSYYGHYWVESKPYGSHFGKVSSHCNVHWVEGIDGLKRCAAKKQRCILQVRWEFFPGGGIGKPNPIRGNYEAAWDKTARAIKPYIDYVEAFYMCDEPYWVGVSPKDLNIAISSVKKRFPKKPVMVVFAVPSFKPDFVVPAKADWLGFDTYNEIGVVARHFQFLKSKLHTHQKLFLVPQSFLNKAAPDDKALAKLNWEYYDLARSEPLVIGLLNFGLFTHVKKVELPLTLEAQRQIGERIIKNSRTSASSGHAKARR
jgi:hypothetical protein